MPAVLRDPVVLGAAACALLLRVAGLGMAPLWVDEVFTAQWVALPWNEVAITALSDNHPPLYFLALKAWSLLAGSSPFALRLPSVALGVALVPVMGALGSEIHGTRAGRGAAWLAALSPFLLHHGQEARMYALVALLGAVSLLQLARFLGDPTRSLRMSFPVVAALLMATHYYTLFFLGGELLLVLLAWRRPLRRWLPAALVTASAAVACLAAAWLISRHGAGGQYDFSFFALPGVFWSLAAGYTLIPSSAELHYGGASAILRYLPYALAGAIPLTAAVISGLRRVESAALRLLLVPLATTLVGPFAVSVVLGVSVNPRYFVTAVPALLLLLAIGSAARTPFQRGLRIGVVALFVVASGLHVRTPGHGREDVNAAGDWLRARASAEDTLLVTSFAMAFLADFHWPDLQLQDYPPIGVVALENNADELARALPPSASGRTYFVIGRAWLSDPLGHLQAAIRAHYPDCGSLEVRGVLVLCLDRTKRPLRRDD